ncbi:MAG: hypothetical protein F4Y03_16210 [Alphaproteobacteria bacterium]|nr:hypothetical protein [Alphaproteobacteria bacterium]
MSFRRRPVSFPPDGGKGFPSAGIAAAGARMRQAQIAAGGKRHTLAFVESSRGKGVFVILSVGSFAAPPDTARAPPLSAAKAGLHLKHPLERPNGLQVQVMVSRFHVSKAGI